MQAVDFHTPASLAAAARLGVPGWLDIVLQ
jgi:hypothetical protein